MTFSVPKKSRILWQIRIFLLTALLCGAVCAFVGFTKWMFIPAGAICAAGLAAVFWYVPAAARAFSVSVSESMIAVKSGVFFKNVHIMPHLKIIYAQSYETPVSKVLHLTGVALRAARATVLVPEIAAEDAKVLLRIIDEGGAVSGK